MEPQPVKEAPPEVAESSPNQNDPMLKPAMASPSDTPQLPPPVKATATTLRPHSSPSKDKSYVSMAILSTLVIVLVLAMLAVYAYLKTY